jgi:hypothetical protein
MGMGLVVILYPGPELLEDGGGIGPGLDTGIGVLERFTKASLIPLLQDCGEADTSKNLAAEMRN